MCGIAGIVDLEASSPPPREALEVMAGALEHRGPDEFGLYLDRHAGLAHTRLSIIDLSTGQQPLSNEDGTLWISFNGEIFNYVELRAELEALGHQFRTRSDTEVIVHAWEAWGEAAFERMNGQWAVALWDSKTRTFVLARDRVGVRPIFTLHHEGRLYFASEVKALFAGAPTFPRELDPIGLDETFTFWTVVPPQSIFKGVRELEPGHVAVWREGRFQHDVAYWQPTYPVGEAGGFKGSLRDATEALTDALENATRLRMVRADVPVGSYLSGGLDSSVVAALAARAKPSGFKTFSLRFADAEYDETPYQRAMVQRLGTDHAEVVVSRADIAEIFPTVIRHTERPILRTAPAPLFLLSRLVRQAGIKVVLTGEGSDEMLAGYDLFREARVRRFWARQPQSSWRPRLLERLYPYLTRSPVSQQALTRQFFGRGLEHARTPGFSHEPRWSGTAALKRLFAPDVLARLQGHDSRARLFASLPEDFSRWSFLAQDQYLEVRTLLSGYLLSSQGDRMLMGNSVEGRFPFLDREVMALANSLPPSYKLKVLDEKHVLKRAAKELVTPEILERPKQPYRAPDASSFVGPGRPAFVDEMMSEAALKASGLFAPAPVAQLWKKCLGRSADEQFSNTDNMAVVGIVSTQLLHRQFVAQAPSAVRPTFKTLVVKL
ncbi:MAG: asparagine synthase (glutamine-hydrolyzing) [Myxococcaceae bacterium]|jgi:asparagine synthase (glutamine-hydrolysing)|nr:asparagine synthase (glutamine-hydrolyzing) [Myxococcaceae bacterium]